MTWSGPCDVENMDPNDDTGCDTDLEIEGIPYISLLYGRLCFIRQPTHYIVLLYFSASGPYGMACIAQILTMLV